MFSHPQTRSLQVMAPNATPVANLQNGGKASIQRKRAVAAQVAGCSFACRFVRTADLQLVEVDRAAQHAKLARVLIPVSIRSAQPSLKYGCTRRCCLTLRPNVDVAGVDPDCEEPGRRRPQGCGQRSAQPATDPQIHLVGDQGLKEARPPSREWSSPASRSAPPPPTT
jgi:hypothetical protein